uniref:Uncharacterized protein n=1 Tax=Anopheles atroparvus TaxID=41427 RepID=A0A182J146_ANOAO
MTSRIRAASQWAPFVEKNERIEATSKGGLKASLPVAEGVSAVVWRLDAPESEIQRETNTSTMLSVEDGTPIKNYSQNGFATITATDDTRHLTAPDVRRTPATLGECERSEEESRSQLEEGVLPEPDRKELAGFGGLSRKRKRRRSCSLARSSSSSSSTTSSLAVVAAKVSRLGRDVSESFRAFASTRRSRLPHTSRHGRSDTTTDEDEDDGEDDMDDDEDGLDDVEDDESHSKDVDEDDTDEEAKESDVRISDRATSQPLPVTVGAIQLPKGKDATGRATLADERPSGRAGSVCAVAYEKNDEKSQPFDGTADLNAPPRQQSRHQHQHQQHPDDYHQQQQQQQQLRHNRPKYDYTRDQMFEIFQPWVIRTYGDRAKTKTITLKKQARIIKTLRGLEMNNPDSSKFRFWVKTKGFTTSKPGNFQDIFTHQNIPENDGCMLYAPSGGLEPGQPYKKVAVVENFFDIIYGVHVSLGSRASRHAGQKRTYRTITETYAFLPREAVTKFLSLCGQCSKLTTKIYPATRPDLKPEESTGADREPDELLRRDESSRLTQGSRVSPVSAGAAATEKGDRSCGSERRSDRSYSSLAYYELLKNFYQNVKHNGARKELVPVRSAQGSGMRNCTAFGVPAKKDVKTVDDSGGFFRQGRGAVSEVANGRSGDGGCVAQAQTMVRRVSECQSRVGLNNNCSEKDCRDSGGGGGGVSGTGERNQAKPITSTYLDVTRSFGLQDDDALNMPPSEEETETAEAGLRPDLDVQLNSSYYRKMVQGNPGTGTVQLSKGHNGSFFSFNMRAPFFRFGSPTLLQMLLSHGLEGWSWVSEGAENVNRRQRNRPAGPE